MERTNSELVALARQGNKDAFGCLIERYQHMVARLVSRMVSNHSVARELAQEAFVQAYLSLNHLRDAARFESWLYGITLNVCRGYLRDQQVEMLSLESARDERVQDGEVDPQYIVEEREMRRHVLQAVLGLSPPEINYAAKSPRCTRNCQKRHARNAGNTRKARKGESSLCNLLVFIRCENTRPRNNTSSF